MFAVLSIYLAKSWRKKVERFSKFTVRTRKEQKKKKEHIECGSLVYDILIVILFGLRLETGKAFEKGQHKSANTNNCA